MSAIPFNCTWSAPGELDNVRDSLLSGQTAGDGTMSRRCCAWLSDHLAGASVMLTPSCTAALELSALLAGVQPGDEVIVPSFTFVSTASAFALVGARLVFADIRPDTLSLDEDHVRRLITPKTRAVCTVHYAGIATNPSPLVDLCAEHGILLIEDTAHGLGGRFGDRPLGTFGALGTLSFHESKNVSCGEGGALIINDPTLVPRAEILRQKGTNRTSFFRKEVAKYTWVDLGSSYLLSDICAAVLLAQFHHFDTIQSLRQQRWLTYHHGLKAWADAYQVRQPFVPEACHHASHLYYLIFPSQKARDAAIAWLKEDDIEAYFHYLPLHSSPAGLRLGTAPLDAPETERVSQRLLRLPLYPSLDAEQQQRIIDRLVASIPTP